MAIANYRQSRMSRDRFSSSILSAVVWLLADLLTDHHYPHPPIPFWNAALRLGFFLVVNMLLALLKNALEREHSLARQDYLTKVYNSRAFYETAKTEIERCRRYHHPRRSLILIWIISKLFCATPENMIKSGREKDDYSHDEKKSV